MDHNAIYGIRGSRSITPSDSATITVTRGLLVDVAGNVKVTYADGLVDTVALSAGMWHGMQVKVIWETDTTATGIHAGY